MGTAEVVLPGDFLEISPEPMSAAFSGSSVIINLARDYSFNFHRRTITALPPCADWPTDLNVPGTSYEDLICILPEDSQVVIGEDAITYIETHARVLSSLGVVGLAR